MLFNVMVACLSVTGEPCLLLIGKIADVWLQHSQIIRKHEPILGVRVRGLLSLLPRALAFESMGYKSGGNRM